MTQYGVAVIGVGSAGGGFVNVFQNEPRAELRAVCDTNEEHLREVSEASGVGDAYLDFRELAGRSDIDVVAICTPDHLHTEPAIAMMESGKHVIVEKPLATTFDDLQRTVETALRTGRKVAHGTQLRFMSVHQEVKRLASEGQIGEFYYAEADYSGNSVRLFTDGAWRGQPGLDYNLVAGGGVHIIDLLLWFVDDEVVEVTSYGNRKCITDTGLDTFDCVVSILQFRKGCVAKTVTSFGTDRVDKDRGIELCGTDGFLVTGSEPGIGRGASKPESEPIVAQDAGNLRSLLVADLIDAVENDREPLTNIAEAARTTAVCLAAYESAKTGRPVKVPKF